MSSGRSTSGGGKQGGGDRVRRPRADVALLQQVSIFSSLSPEEIENVLPALHPVNVEEGTILFHEGDEGQHLYIIREGSVATTIRLPSGADQEIAAFGAGEFFGEMSIFEKAPRSATCTTREPTSLFTMSQEDFFRLIEDHPYIAIKIMYLMLQTTTQRLRNTSGFLVDMVRWGEAARKRAITDPLTGVYNRRYLDDVLSRRFEEARREGTALSLIMVDLDYFREINEQHGHEIGDRVIMSVVEVFNRRLRPEDIIARYGGDEFTILLPDTGLARAREMAETICREVAGLEVLPERGRTIRRVTTSQGIASYPESAETLEALRESADRALYNAKENGRNRVSCSPHTMS